MLVGRIAKVFFGDAQGRRRAGGRDGHADVDVGLGGARGGQQNQGGKHALLVHFVSSGGTWSRLGPGLLPGLGIRYEISNCEQNILYNNHNVRDLI